LKAPLTKTMSPLTNASKPVAVFLGPSLNLEEARRILDADYYSPARKGDVYKIIASGVETIVLLDGLFHNTPSVWQRELLDAMAEGILVIGASSMGALRAAELHTLGMKGLGTIFEWYRDGRIEGDDEVALLHGPEDFGYPALSTPLVNIRYTLLRAVEDGCITDEQAQQLANYAKSLYYPNRSFHELLHSQIVKSWPEKEAKNLKQYFATRSVDLKRLDAIAALQRCANERDELRRTSIRIFSVPTSSRQKFDRLLLTGFHGLQRAVTGEELLIAAQKETPLKGYLWTILSKRYFILEWARQKGVTADHLSNIEPGRTKTEELPAFRDRWLRANGLTPGAFKELRERRRFIRHLVAHAPQYFGGEEGAESSGLAPMEMALWFAHQKASGQATEVIAESATIDETVAVHEHNAETFIHPSIDCGFAPEGEDETCSLTDEKGGEPMPERVRLELALSERLLILDWATKSGISCPQELSDSYIEEWEERQHERNMLAPERTPEARRLLRERSLVDWIIKKGPAYFGFDWIFGLELVQELQITGVAARILASLQVTE
jgi:hypothetical protein